ncbi:MAG: flagellar biosynthetic protein FliR [Proteobacteria bacterium]|nr:flagellar biosynthetic protein FliR [Pseudomonadota bacterium]
MNELAPLFEMAGNLAFVAVGVFTRIGAALFLVPGIGERAVPVRLRLGAALALAVLLAPLIAPLVEHSPATVSALVGVILAEAAVGLIIGLAFRLLVMTLQTAGSLAAQNLSISQMFGAGVAPEPEPTIATLLGMGGIVLALMAGLHVHLVAALAGLYQTLPFGEMPGAGELAEWSTARVAETFALGLSLALPFIAIAFAYNLALGALSRAMPQLLVSLIGAPLLIGLGLIVLYLSMPEIFARWGAVLGRVLADPLGGLLGGAP